MVEIDHPDLYISDSESNKYKKNTHIYIDNSKVNKIEIFVARFYA